MSDIYSVQGITAYIADILSSEPPLQDVHVRGEVSNMRAAASGHWYFTIKDANAQLKCVMFRSSTAKQSVEPRDGEAVVVHGRVGVYEARGEYQLYADEIQLAGGVGDLYRRFEELKAKLDAEGLFSEKRKRFLPAFPARIGIVTSPDAAAFRDIQNVLTRRFPLAEVILSPTLVQGNEAPPLIVKAIERLIRDNTVDVMLITRGGGSIEDLWAFNDEAVARMIAASPIPTVSGVGHETDFTIADFVADVRAPTPSAAAEVATPDLGEYRLDLERNNEILQRLIVDLHQTYQSNLVVSNRALKQTSPERHVANMRQRIDDISERIDTQQQRNLALLRERLETRIRALDNANPQALLKRGYAIVKRTDDGKLIQRETDAPVGTGITIQLNEGELTARVEDKDSHGQYRRTLF